MSEKSIANFKISTVSEIISQASRNAVKEILRLSDEKMNYVLAGYFLFGLFLAFFHDSYFIAIGVGGISIAIYQLVKWLLPDKTIHHYVLSVLFAIFPALYIYQMHGLSAMHFTFFIGAVLLITYRSWKMMLTLAIVTIVHHTILALLQYRGMEEVYFTQLNYMNLQTYLFHAGLAVVIFGVCGYWAVVLDKAAKSKATQTALLEMQKEIVKHNMDFAETISSGNLEAEHKNRFNDEDELGQSLLKMRDSLREGRKREDHDKFINVGIAEVTDIIRQFNEDTEVLAYEFVSKMVKYTGCNQGALFLLEGEDDDDAYLELSSCYAYERRKFLQKKISVGEGLVGQCFLEKASIYLTEIPKDYINITSGLGLATPNAVYLSPVKTEEQVVGVLELASFQLLDEHKKSFIEKALENLASAIVSSRTTQRIKMLLEQSQQQTEEMRAQEEEMRQNMEELQSTQEAIARQAEETEKIKRDFEIRDSVFERTTILSEADIHGTITYANNKLCEVAKYTREEMIGQPHSLFRHPDMPKELFKYFWDTLKKGDVFNGIIKNRAKDGSVYWVDATIVPVKDENGKTVKYIGARYHITNEDFAIAMYNQQADRLNLPRMEQLVKS
ncbi:PAS domain-containing protein [Fulvivirga sp. 29W222]|uniref:PAS domain-containing protein n=1 Tax=Fulvivirga marina TaxID=2494733 RepID=A0A937KCW8_9BACT|nr:PAS domain-containing protein [Fulvivirga marina]MBL6445430.1 PAS domain-containing protein [Fulvivirga marina]